MAIVALICLLAACAFRYTIPQYIDELAADGETINRLGIFEGGNITAVYIIHSKGGKARSIAQEAEVEGFKNTIRVLTLIDVKDGLIDNIEVLAHNETEDYGGHVTEEWFLDRFMGKDAGMKLRLVKMAAQSREDIVAITGATYTSQAVVNAVNSCMENYRKIIEEVD